MLEEFPDSDYSLSAPEEWAWERIRRGEVADMRRAPGGGGSSAPCNPVKGGVNAWKTVARTLSAKFIKIVATRLCSADIPGDLRIHIVCAIVKGKIDIANANVEMELRIENCSIVDGIIIDAAHFRRGLSINGSVVELEILGRGAVFDRDFFVCHGRYPYIHLESAKIGGDLVAKDSIFTGVFRADRITVNGGMFLQNRAIFEKECRLPGAKIGKELAVNNSIFKGEFFADSIEVKTSLSLIGGSVFEGEVRLVDGKIGGQFFANGSKFKEQFVADSIKVNSSVHFQDNAIFAQKIRLLDAKIGGEFSTIGSTFDGNFEAERVIVGKSMFLRNGAKFKQSVNLLGAKIGSDLDASGSAFNGIFVAESAKVHGNVFMRDGAEFNNPINLGDMRVDGNIILNNAHFANSLNLENAKIEKALVLFGHDERHPTHPKWKANAKLILHNTRVGALRAQMPESWRIDNENDVAQRQVDTDLIGFTYDRLDTQAHHRGDPVPLLKWIQNSVSASIYTPQPYTRLAKVLREMGAEDAADDVDIARYSHYYKTRKARLEKIWGKIRYCVDCYGVRPWRSIRLFGVVALVGAFFNLWVFAQPESVCTMHFGIDFWLYF
ncbi:MAG: hypothetical protein MPL62_14335, partial [Alphaproteobacteria bacterium]|nr:hypothetical protein [Alphaproteobacteria bacterium]